MTSSRIRIDQLKQMLTLEQRRSALQNELDSLVRQLNALRKNLFAGAGSAAPPTSAKPTPAGRRKRKGSKRGQLSAAILEALKAAGSKGVTVADLATLTGVNYKNIYVWFATTGKKHSLTKIAPATYRLS